jgi:uncharacterized protein involved in exopolysaccharide biosynthesis
MVEEVELLDYWNAIRRSWWLIVSGTVACALTAFVVSLVLTKTYVTTIDLIIGEVWNTPIEDPYRVAESVNSKPFLAKTKEKVPDLLETVDEMDARQMVSAQTVEGGTGPSGKKAILVKVTTKGRTPKQAVDLARGVADLIIQEYQSRYEQTLAQYKTYEKDLDSQIGALRRDIGDLELILKKQRESPSTSAPAVILLQAQLEQKQTQLLNFVRELRDVKINNFSETRTSETRVVLPPVLPERKSSPKTTVIVLVATALGFLFTLAIVFFIDYLDRAKRRRQLLAATSEQTQPVNT